jgi:arginine N-succinyltransferase
VSLDATRNAPGRPSRVIQYRFADADELSTFGPWREGADWESHADSRVLLACEMHVDASASAISQVLPWQHDIKGATRLRSGMKQVLGGIRIQSRIGLRQPRYWYHIGCVVRAAAELGMFQRERTLLLGNDLTGASELSELYLNAAALSPAEHSALTQNLVRAALYILQRELASDEPAEPVSTSFAATSTRVICALSGVRNQDHDSPFWEGLGRHFYPGDVTQAQAHFGSLWQTHVAALLPRHPLVASLLNTTAQAAIATAHTDMRDLQNALVRSGFQIGQHVTLFDAGPVYEIQLEAGEPASNWSQRNVRIAAQLQPSQTTLMSTALDPLIWQIDAQERNAELLMSSETAALLSLRDDQTVWVAR